MTPMDKVEVLYQDLVQSYGEADDAEIRAASKLLMVALYNLKQNSGSHWYQTVQQYLDILRDEPENFERFMQTNRSDYDQVTDS